MLQALDCWRTRPAERNKGKRRGLCRKKNQAGLWQVNGFRDLLSLAPSFLSRSRGGTAPSTEGLEIVNLHSKVLMNFATVPLVELH